MKSLVTTQANAVIHDVIDLMSDITIKNSGKVVKTIGDEVMCRFSKVDNAFITASVIQEMLQNRPKVSGFKDKSQNRDAYWTGAC